MNCTSSTQRRHQVVYLVRHAEATHNIKEREAVQRAISNGVVDPEEQQKARRAVLQDESLKDAPLSSDGAAQVSHVSQHLNVLNKAGLAKFPAPQLVLVSPLRRALMTATQLFYKENGGETVFVALEALREKRTGFAADERRSVDELEREFPHVNFADLKRTTRTEVPLGEDNAAVRARGGAFLHQDLSAYNSETAVAIVSHKGWLRELRHTFQELVDQGKLHVDFDLEQWQQTLYKNAEIRVNSFGWEGSQLKSVVSKSVENALGSVVEEACRALVEKHLQQMSKLPLVN